MLGPNPPEVTAHQLDEIEKARQKYHDDWIAAGGVKFFLDGVIETHTAAMLEPDGWLHTGDIGMVDEDGYLFVVDRLKELIKYKGFQVAPAELESLLLKHPAVADAAVIPQPDAEAGEVPKAFVVMKGSASPEELMAFVNGQVAPFKKIRQLEVVSEIPKSPAGKILRRTLIERERSHAGA